MARLEFLAKWRAIASLDPPYGKLIGPVFVGPTLHSWNEFRYADAMRRWQIFLGLFLLIVLVVGVFAIVYRQPLARQWTLYRIGAAESSQEADVEIARCETAPEAELLIGEMIDKWGSGNRRFDLHLAGHLGGRSCGETLREAFSKEITRREGLLERWARYWTWRAQLPPDQQMASVAAYYDALRAAEPPRNITWREVLDLQAVFQLTGCGELAQNLSPANWRERYGQWQQKRPSPLPAIPRPEEPFP